MASLIKVSQPGLLSHLKRKHPRKILIRKKMFCLDRIELKMESYIVEPLNNAIAANLSHISGYAPIMHARAFHS